MALITCYECGQQMSDKAPVCPHCGAPVSVGDAAEERKCGECGAVLPDGATACPFCGCPADSGTVQPVQTAQTAYTVPSVHPSLSRLDSEKVRARANVWLFCVIAASVVMYLIAFVKYTDFIGKVEDFTKNHSIITGIATSLFKEADEMINSVNVLKWLLIGALVIMAIAVICDLVRLSRKKLMLDWMFGIPVLEIAGFVVPISMLNNIGKNVGGSGYNDICIL